MRAAVSEINRAGHPALGSGCVRMGPATAEYPQTGATTVDSPATLTTLLTGHHPGDTLRLTWLDVAERVKRTPPPCAWWPARQTKGLITANRGRGSCPPDVEDGEPVCWALG